MQLNDLKNLFSYSDNETWKKLLSYPDISIEEKEVIRNFLIEDSINVEKFTENEKTNDFVNSFMSLDSWERTNNLKINCTPTFREYFSESLLDRTPGLPDWFYIAYPDVAIWVINDKGLLENELNHREHEFINENGMLNESFLFRYFIDKYKEVTGKKLECSISQ